MSVHVVALHHFCMTQINLLKCPCVVSPHGIASFAARISTSQNMIS